MRDEHKQIFLMAATKFQCWIGLREPNPLSEQWIGKSVDSFRCQPKGVECKAKTADNLDHVYGGLVLDPFLCPGGFKRETLDAAQSKWKTDFLKGNSMPVNFYCIKDGKLKGLVRYYDSVLYADYDLMNIVKSNSKGEWVFTENYEETRLFNSIKPLLNRELGEPLIQHGTEFMYNEGVGARESELVYWFGPGGRFQIHGSSMPKGGH
jgi:hypothetical protein